MVPFEFSSTTTTNASVQMADAEDLRTSGPFTQREIGILEQAVASYQADQNLTDYQVRELIQDSDRSHNRTTAPLWLHICSALSHREKPAIQKVTRRRFHNYSKRGKWTPEEEGELLDAYKQFPQRWKEIGRLINRFPEDCRDRYRNYLKCGAAQKKDVWNAAETRQFKTIVNGVLDDLRTDASRTTKKRKLSETNIEAGRDSLELLIDWDVVSDRMGRTRSRLQCRNKWEKLKDAEVRELAIDQARLATGLDENKGPSPRYLQAQANYQRMLPGDKHMVISYIRDSLQAENRKYEHEIPWLLMQKGTEDECRWTLPERKVCLREMKSVVPAPKKGSFMDYLDAMLGYLERKYPGQIDTYYDGPLDYIFTTVPKQAPADPRRRAPTGTHSNSTLAAPGTLASNGLTVKTSSIGSVPSSGPASSSPASSSPSSSLPAVYSPLPVNQTIGKSVIRMPASEYSFATTYPSASAPDRPSGSSSNADPYSPDSMVSEHGGHEFDLDDPHNIDWF